MIRFLGHTVEEYNRFMKTMTCKDLGGPCDQRLSATTNHPDTAKEMEKMHNEDPKKWGAEMKPKWDASPEA